MAAAALNIATPKKPLIGRLFAFKPPAVQPDARRKGAVRLKFDVRTVNAFLIAGIAVVAVYLAVSVIAAYANMRKDITAALESNGGAGKSFAPLKSPLKTQDYYLEKARVRSLFVRSTKNDSSGVVSSGPSQAILDATKNLKLVGISWSDDPDAMIEDTQSQATFFLKKGQPVVNEVYLKEILKNKVILRYGNEELALE